MKQRVMVTGGFGYIGSELVKALERSGAEYLSIDKKNKAGKRSRAFDLCDRKEVLKVASGFRPDVFIHCGTYSALAYRDNFLQSFREDSQALANVIEALSAFPKCRLIFFSSSYVYSGLSGKVTESTSLKPSHNFGMAKAFFEQFILRNHTESVVFRLSSVFGPGNALNPNAIFNMAKECKSKGELTVWGSGRRMMQYVAMKDVVSFVLGSIPPGIYNLGGSEYVSVAESAKMIAKSYNARVVFLKDKPEGETLPFMENGKLRKAAKASFTPFKEALQEYLELIGRISKQFKVLV